MEVTARLRMPVQRMMAPHHKADKWLVRIDEWRVVTRKWE